MVELDSSMWIYVIALIIGKSHVILKPVIYGVTLYVSLAARSHTAPFIWGLMIAELSSNNVFSWIQRKKWLNVCLQSILGVCIFGFGASCLPNCDEIIQIWYSTWSRTSEPGEFLFLVTSRIGLYLLLTELGSFWANFSFVNHFVAVSIVLLLELNIGMQTIFSSRPLLLLGKYSFAFVSYSSKLSKCLVLHSLLCNDNATAGYSSSLGTTFRISS